MAAPPRRRGWRAWQPLRSLNASSCSQPRSRASVSPTRIGGAIALGYHTRPRATSDIDPNVFVPEYECEPTLAVVASLGLAFDFERTRSEIQRDGQIRLRWPPINLDLFFMTVPFLEASRDRASTEDFEGHAIRVLSVEDLVVCKVAFNREKDWVDLREVVAMQGATLNVGYIRRWLEEIVGPDDARSRRFDALLADSAGS